MRRLLFLVDQPNQLDGLEPSFRLLRDALDVHAAGSPESALRLLESGRWEVIVATADGEEGGRELFDAARKRFPEIVRIGLVGKVDAQFLEQGLVHQFVRKPWDPAELRVAVERACRLKDLLGDELICRTVGELKGLPAIPAVCQKLAIHLRDPDISLQEIARIIEQDSAISAKLLQLVNSTLFRTTCEIATVRTAASYLGLEVIKNLVLSVELFRAFEGLSAIPGFSLEALQAHCQLATSIARCLPLSRDRSDAAIVASLLHDVGKLVLAWKAPGRFAKFLSVSRRRDLPLYRVEEELWGITHAEVGAYLLGLWGFPLSITEAVAFHHAPARIPRRGFDVAAAVYVANLLAHECCASARQASAVPYAEPDANLLQDLRVADQFPGWKAMARQQAALLRIPVQPDGESAELLPGSKRCES